MAREVMTQLPKRTHYEALRRSLLRSRAALEHSQSDYSRVATDAINACLDSVDGYFTGTVAEPGSPAPPPAPSLTTRILSKLRLAS